MKQTRRKVNFFEKVLLVAGFFIGVIGFYIINHIFKNSGHVFGFEMVTAVFLWIILLFLMIIVAAAENQKEEALYFFNELHEETKMMRSIMKELVCETKLLRKELDKTKKK